MDKDEAEGIIVFNKPVGMSSAGAVGLIRRLTGVRKVGHTGTLDPMAEGVLPVCVGGATRVIEFIEGYGGADAKAYACEMTLGLVTDTQDIWGERTGGKAPGADVTEAAVRRVLKSFEGEGVQTPPMYSALKYKGKKLYEYARKGEELPEGALKPRRIWIRRVTVDRVDLSERRVAFHVECSKGTYMRTLCHDAGAAFGCGAAMSALKRTKSGVFGIADSVAEAEILRLMDSGSRGVERMLPADAAIPFLPSVPLSQAAAEDFANGRPARVRIENAEEGAFVRAYYGTRFLGVGRPDSGALKPYKVFVAPREI
jgi:tRNA pseudouridine55 synthase